MSGATKGSDHLKVQKSCVHCETQFETIYETKLYCSSRCNGAAAHKRHHSKKVEDGWLDKRTHNEHRKIEKECNHCGGTFDALSTKAKWCSGICRDRSREKRVRPDIKSKMKASKASLRDFIAQDKMDKGCIDCGYNSHAAALDHDHVRGEKKFGLAQARSMAEAIEEIAKCEVRCANCHRVKTSERWAEAKAKTANDNEPG